MSSFLNSLVFISVMFMTSGLSYAESLQEPPLPTIADGFFPTQVESPLLRGPYDARSYGGGLSGANGVGPDSRMQTATDLFPYQQQQSNFYQRNPGIFANMDQTLGIFLPHDAWTVETGLRRTALTFDANMGLLTRNFSPDLATVKAGPLYFDLLYLGAGAIWSDYNGNNGPQKTDGFISNLNMGVRGLLRITDTVYFSLAAQLMYLPGTNQFAFGLGTGAGSSFVANLSYGDSIGAWDVRFSDNFAGRPGINFTTHTNEPGSDQAGRYRFGIRQSQAGNNANFYTRNGAYFSNRLIFNASRLVLDDQWRFWSQLDHTDFWRTFDFTGHRQREHLGLALGYEGSIIPFAPRFTYNVWTADKFKSYRHQIGMQLRGRITENVNWAGFVGYGLATGSVSGRMERMLWNMRFSHTLSARTKHTVSFGEGYFFSDYTNDALSARYFNYQITHGFARNLRGSIFAQISDRENTISTGSSVGSGNATSRAGGGATLTYQPLDFTSISAKGLYNTALKPDNGNEVWILRLTINQQLGMRLTGSIFYQYIESASDAASFSEHAIGLSLRRYF